MYKQITVGVENYSSMQSDWSQFFGRFHPLIVHLPIGIILLAAILQICEMYQKNKVLRQAIDIALFTGACSAALAALSGYFLASAGGYNSHILFWHRWSGISLAICTLLAWLLRKFSPAGKEHRKITCSNLLLASCVLLVLIGGHLGGTMTHGDNYLTAHMPLFLQHAFGNTARLSIKPRPVALDSVIIFRDIIQPILSGKCTGCHNPGKLKGELDLTSEAGITRGGKSGNAIVAGDLVKSELFRRVTLQPGSSKFMPADNHPPLLPIEKGFIKWWILAGASFKKDSLAKGSDEKIKYLVSTYLGIDEETEKEIVLPKVPAADSVVVNQLKEKKVVVRAVTSKSNLLDVSFVMVQQRSEAQVVSLLEKLSAIREQLYLLDVNNCRLTKEGIILISRLDRLNKLQIQKDNLADEAIASLGALQQLTSLNAGQNRLTDNSIAIFGKIPTLKKINLWQTGITEQGIKKLQAKLPGVVIDYGKQVPLNNQDANLR